MALKGIKIDTNNQKTLAGKYSVGDGDEDDVLPIGFWLVTDFGNEETFDTVTPDNFDDRFNVGEKIENGFFAISAKIVVP